MSPDAPRWRPDPGPPGRSPRRVAWLEFRLRGLRRFVEREFDDFAREFAAPGVDRDRGARLGRADVEEGHGDAVAERGAEAAAGDDADLPPAGLDGVTLAGGALGV